MRGDRLDDAHAEALDGHQRLIACPTCRRKSLEDGVDADARRGTDPIDRPQETIRGVRSRCERRIQAGMIRIEHAEILGSSRAVTTITCMDPRPVHLDLVRESGLTVHWSDGRESFYPVLLLRRLSPSAEQRMLREQMASNPLTVLPANPGADRPLSALDAELVGNYAIRIRFSDGHDTGIFSWTYLHSIDPDALED